MNPARDIIKKLGGVRKTAHILDISPSTVSRWMMPPEQGGTGGIIPAKRQGPILQYAKNMGISITPSELIAQN